MTKHGGMVAAGLARLGYSLVPRRRDQGVRDRRVAEKTPTVARGPAPSGEKPREGRGTTVAVQRSMTSRTMSIAEPAPSVEEITEITDDMILELEPQEARGKLLYLPPPLPRAQPLPASSRSRQRRRGTYPVVPDRK